MERYREARGSRRVLPPPSVLPHAIMNVFRTNARAGGHRVHHRERRANRRCAVRASIGAGHAVSAGMSNAFRSSRSASTCSPGGASRRSRFSTHMDTVPPFFPSREDDQHIWGRGACDTKGIIASMIFAVRELAGSRPHESRAAVCGGRRAQQRGRDHGRRTIPRGSKFLINGEPTENKLALGSKGALRLELIASGRMAHSAYPELGESAIEKLLDALERSAARCRCPRTRSSGQSTLNIGTISGGRAPNVIPDHAQAELFIRLVDDGESTTRGSEAGRAAARWSAKSSYSSRRCIWASLPGFETTVVAFTTDIPAFGEAWGKPYLLGPGSIHVAHTSRRAHSQSADLRSNTNLQANGPATSIMNEK